jgi:(1->4)-alpha-D-glucan 1-alpha-D-glucosylmutase
VDCSLVFRIMKPRISIPIATYRLQLNHDFTFAQATEIVPYLYNLGISHCYLSPCLKARPESMHGYDIVDHNSFNPEIGSAADFDRFVEALHQRGMGVLLDIVPNHMGVMGGDNKWWLDVLENGQSSIYASFFDIDWKPLKEELHGKVLVPALHDHYGAVLESGELKLVFSPERGEFDVCYRNHRFPVDPKEYPRTLQRSADVLAKNLDSQDPDLLEFQSLITAFRNLPGKEEAGDRIAERNRDKEIHKRRLAELCARSTELTAQIVRVVDQMNGDPSNPESFEDLHELIKAQTFRLANWRVAFDDINYRRFFDANDLAGLCMENEAVFDATHRFVLDLIAQGKVDGLRVDHPDGLYDPAKYFDRLKRAVVLAAKTAESGNGAASHYLVIEKILTGSERLPREWPVDGTTGYDFANLVNGLFVDTVSLKRFENIYRNFIKDEIDIDDLFYDCRKLIIRVALASELNVLANRLSRIALSKRRTCDFTLNSLRDALTEVVASFPVYRTYVTQTDISDRDAEYIGRAVTSAKWRSPAGDPTIFDFIEAVLLTRIAEGHDAAYRDAVTTFAMKFQQFTSPVMAKGLEDTAFYRYNRLVSLNDVGNDLHRFGTAPADFHAANRERLHDWPHTMLATSTHDSKRSEDVRARLNVLSEIPALWRLRLRDWKRLNRRHKRLVNGEPAPSLNDEYLLYQTLVGAWPSDALNDKNNWKIFRERIESYMLKALREAKENTSWINRNADYEDAVVLFIRALLSSDAKNRFLDDFLPFQRSVARLGVWNSLSQTLLKLACPGVPDIYQGNETLDFSLVDPDNRRPIDYSRRRQLLSNIRQLGNNPEPSSIHLLFESVNDDQVKMHLICRTLCLRRQQPELFSRGEYSPVAAGGPKAQHVFAFERRSEETSAIIIVPRLVAGLLGESGLAPVGANVWGDTHISLPNRNRSIKYQNVFTGEILTSRNADDKCIIDLPVALKEFPVALCIRAS